MRFRVLFQGSHRSRGPRQDTPEQFSVARDVAAALGASLVGNGFEVILTGAAAIDIAFGEAAADACRRLQLDPREWIRTYPHGPGAESARGFGMVLQPADRRWQEVRTFVVQEADAVVSVLGGKGTSDCIQKAELAGKPVFPIPRAGGASEVEFRRLRSARYAHAERGDLEFLADHSLDASGLAEAIAARLMRILAPRSASYSRRVFVVHGHDSVLRNEVARFLERLELQPVILAEQPERGQDLLSKLRTELADVGYAFILLTPDDVGASGGEAGSLLPRVRQNVLFEHGLLLGLLGPQRVCGIVRGEVELPSDLQGLVFKRLTPNATLASLHLDLARELLAAGYSVDANRLLGV